MFRPFEKLIKTAQSAQGKLENWVMVARLADTFSVLIKQDVRVPLKTQLTIPIKADVMIDTVIETRIDVPLELTLDKQSLQLEQLDIVLDETLHIEDTVTVDLNIPLDSTVKAYNLVNVPVEGTLPLKLNVPINQEIRVKGSLRPQVRSFSIPLKTRVSVPVAVPIKQKISIEADVTVNLDHTMVVPLEELVTLEPGTTFKVNLKNLSWDTDSKDETEDG